MVLSTELWNKLFGLKPKDELIALVYRQLSDDFQRAGCPVAFDKTLSPHDWSHEIAVSLKQQPQHVIQQLIYVVDLPETLVFAIQPEENYLQQLADAFIYRELVKIYYKLTYST